MTYYRVRIGKHIPVNPFECEIYSTTRARALCLLESYKNYIRTHFRVDAIRTDTPDWFIYAIESNSGNSEIEIECCITPYNCLIGFVSGDIIPEHLKAIL